MTEQKMLDYLLSTDLYEKGSTRRPYKNMFYEKRMLCTDDTIPIKDFVKRFIKMYKYRNGRPWNIQQILSNIDIIIPRIAR